MGHQYQPLEATSLSSLEADIFSGPGGHQLGSSPQWVGLDLDLDLDVDGDSLLAAPAAKNATSSGGYGSAGGSGSHRKISHNAYERDRRKQLNELYSSLRSLLPDADHTKKLSIPIIVTGVLKYIPELQKQVDTLEKKKEELTRASCKPGVLTMKENTALIVSTTCLDDTDIMVHASQLSNMTGALPISQCIKVLENEGLRVVSSSTSAFQNRTFYNLHLQRTQRTIRKDCQALCDELENVIKKNAGIHPEQ